MNDMQTRLRETLDHDAWSLPTGDLARRVEQRVTRRRRVRAGAAAAAVVLIVGGAVLTIGAQDGGPGPTEPPIADSGDASLSADARYAVAQLAAGARMSNPEKLPSLGAFMTDSALDAVVRGRVVRASEGVLQDQPRTGAHLVRIDVDTVDGLVGVAVAVPDGVDLDRLAAGLADLGEVAVLANWMPEGHRTGADAFSDEGAVLTVAEDGTLAAPVQGHQAGSAWLAAPGGGSLANYDQLVQWLGGVRAEAQIDVRYVFDQLGSHVEPFYSWYPRWFGEMLPTHVQEDFSWSDVLVRGEVVAATQQSDPGPLSLTVTIRVDEVLPGAAASSDVQPGAVIDVNASVLATVDVDEARLLSGLRLLDDPVFMISRGSAGTWYLSDLGRGLITVDDEGRLEMPVRGEGVGSRWFRDGDDQITTYDELYLWLTKEAERGT